LLGGKGGGTQGILSTLMNGTQPHQGQQVAKPGTNQQQQQQQLTDAIGSLLGGKKDKKPPPK